MKYAIAWLLVLILAAGISGRNWLRYRRIAAQGVSGRATVVELLPKLHNTVHYQYAVGGQTFQGRMQSWPPNAPLEQLSVGQSLVIFYELQDPVASVLGDPKPILRNETISVLLAAFGVPTFVVLVWWRVSRKHEAQRVTTVAE